MPCNKGQQVHIKKYLLLAVLASVIILLFVDVPTAAYSDTDTFPGADRSTSLSDSKNVIYKPVLVAEPNRAYREPVGQSPSASRQRLALKTPPLARQPEVHPDIAVSKDDVVALITIHAASYHLAPALPLAIARCESGLRADAKNATSTAAGVFQYLSGTWANTPAGRAGESVFDADANIRMAISHIATQGTAPWASSQSCWDV